MKFNFLSAGAILGATTLVLMGQAADLPPPKTRQVAVDAATALVSRQRDKPQVPGNIVNPFIGKELPVSPVAQPQENLNTALAAADLLGRLAANIAASGTANIGGQSILLVGQKRLKVGDTVRISFESQVYELSIVSISTTSFTIKKGELTHTRPIRLTP